MKKQINLLSFYSRYILLALFIVSIQGKVMAQSSYYVSSSIGDDTYDGLAPAWDGTHGPWRTISKVNSQTLNAGSSVLLKRGDVWNEQLTVHNSGSLGVPITYSAYGSGNNPLISGEDTINSWALHDAGNNIWVDTVSTTITSITQVFIDGTPYTPARWPNTGWNTIDSNISSGLSLFDASLTQSDSYWVGAKLVIRSCNWEIHTKTITTSSGSTNTISWEGALPYGCSAKINYGYYIENKFEELDNAGEFFFDATNHLLYIALPSGESPSSHLIEASVRDYGIKADGKSYISISNIDIQKAAKYGIYANYNDYWSIKNCNISYCKNGGINSYTPGRTSMDIQDNTITHVDEGEGIFVYNISSTNIINNTIENIASDSISPKSGKAIYLGGTSTNSAISGNIIHNISSHGIYSSPTCSPVTISNNVLSRSVIQLQDNGAIYIAGDQTGTIVEYNRIDDCPGNYQGTPTSSGNGTTVGLYLDEYSSHSICRYNIVSGCAFGTLLHKATESALFNNTFYNNRVASIVIGENDVNQMHDNIIKNNLCYAVNSAQMTLQINRPAYSDSTCPVGTFNNNLYFNPERDDHIQIMREGSNYLVDYYTLAEWQLKTGRDAGNDSLSIASNPLLEDVATGDFHLTSLSPCIDSGVDIGLSYDFDSIPVPQGNAPDIGAYESQSVSSEEYVWTGNVSTDWEDGDNWNLGTVPSAESNVTIPAVTNNPVANRLVTSGTLTIAPGGVLTLINDTVAGENNSPQSLPDWEPVDTTYYAFTNNGTVIIQSDSTGTGSLIAESASGSGSATVNCYMETDAWHLISSPVSGQSVADFLSENANIPVNASSQRAMMDYNPGQNIWTPYFTDGGGDGDLGGGKGFAVRVSSDTTVTFTGSLQAGNTVVSAITSKWNCIGNPYTSSIGITDGSGSASNFLALNSGNIDPAYGVYVWYDGSYTTISNVSGAYPVQQGQAFFVKMNSSSDTISFSHDLQIHNTGLKLKSGKASKPIIKLVASLDKLNSSTTIAFIDGMTKGLDPSYDAGLFKGDAEMVVYTRLVEDYGVPFAIQALPDDEYDSMVIPVGVDSERDGEVVFSAELTTLPTECKAILEDKLTGTLTDLAFDSYKATIAANTEGYDRFFLHTSYLTTETEDILVRESLFAYATINKEIIIKGWVGKRSYATLHDISGNILFHRELQEGSINVLQAPVLRTGIYILSVRDNGRIQNFKIPVNE